MRQGNDRIKGFDALRLVMVLLVIMLHAAMTYMMFVPQWWYVIDDNRSFAMAMLVVFLDSFPMSALFFLSGYFAPPSLAKRGTSLFLRDKFMRIGLPWILGVAFVAPFFAYASYLKYGIGPVTAWGFMTGWFFGPFYQQGHYWFLGVLFLFLLAYAIFCKGGAGAKAEKAAETGKSPAALIAALWTAGTLSYCLAAYFIKPAVEWVNIMYVLYFQHARFVGYAGFFALGTYGWRAGWFSEGGWVPSPAKWGAAGIVSSALLLRWTFFKAPGLDANTNIIIEAVLYNSTMIAMTFFTAGLFMRKSLPFEKAVGILSPHSYPIYWLHQIVLTPLVYFLKPFHVSVAIKWAVSSAFTVFVCYLLSAYFLKRAPFLKRIF
ncbi:MAG: acyltransferase family protein [Synergistaceae bacterium]|jgi:peptidoglycan/LPS O-acetylase OafA/YrhL|nr:acyltransferase family protein [Synergistaceae bacterium]